MYRPALSGCGQGARGREQGEGGGGSGGGGVLPLDHMNVSTKFKRNP